MASAFAAAVPHSVPHPPVQHISRVRPPRFLKGQPRDIDIPQPDGPVPVEHQSEIWVQGRWRNRASNAAVDRQKVLSQQVKKAVQRHTHGCNIYAYYHLRTKQVVYSTSRIMRPGQILPQLIFHGKKTVPSGLRRDVWRPYFSIHFPETDSGKRIGLDAYKRLREFAKRRQLNPDPESLLATQADVDRALRSGGDPLEARELFKNPTNKKKLDIPILGQKLPQNFRARRLMDQKATSVADVAHVLALAVEPLRKLRLNAKRSLEQKTEAVMANVGSRARKTLKFKRAREQQKALQIEEKQKLVDTAGTKPGSMPLDRKMVEQIALEFDGTILDESNHVVNLKEIPERPMHEYEDVDSDVQILWADMRDGTYAASWAEGIYHGELQPLALNKRAVMAITQPEHRAADGTLVSEQRQRFVNTVGKSVHVHGRQLSPRFTTFQDAIARQLQQRREVREAQAEFEEQDQLVKFLIPAYEKVLNLAVKAGKAQQKDDKGEELSKEEQQAIADVEKIGEEWLKYDEAHPRPAQVAQETVLFRQMVEEYVSIQAEQDGQLGRSQAADHDIELAILTERSESRLQKLAEGSPSRFIAVRTFLEDQRLHAENIKTQEGRLRKLTNDQDGKPGAETEAIQQDIAKQIAELQTMVQREKETLDALEWNAVQGLVGGEPVPTIAERLNGESEAEYLKRTQGVVVQEKKGLWARLKGLMGRS